MCFFSCRGNSSHVTFVLVASVAAAHIILSLVCFAFRVLVTFFEYFDFLSEILNLSVIALKGAYNVNILSTGGNTETRTRTCIFIAHKFTSIYCILCDEAECTHTRINLTIKYYVMCLGGLRYSSAYRHV